MTNEKLIEHMKQREKELKPTLVRKKEQIKGMIALYEFLVMGEFKDFSMIKKFFDGRYPK